MERSCSPQNLQAEINCRNQAGYLRFDRQLGHPSKFQKRHADAAAVPERRRSGCFGRESERTKLLPRLRDTEKTARSLSHGHP
jgi:hypothetical protein